jgi:DNA invertase Pin-like site-specific DNA recombinase
MTDLRRKLNDQKIEEIKGMRESGMTYKEISSVTCLSTFAIRRIFNPQMKEYQKNYMKDYMQKWREKNPKKYKTIWKNQMYRQRMARAESKIVRWV